ncbi:hypothetical protein P389DRAFT_207890 [Cystobasidium minutum MCA 4210]|uniref:uncharacterized protein n=1 Tax=Cystobasidium minutum MCA 4210 TaxID=1397322 RepID=UPI0034CFE3FA|eukprot:jgi/Rhomi1/207890/estExt_Genemark1.C_1_t20371
MRFPPGDRVIRRDVDPVDWEETHIYTSMCTTIRITAAPPDYPEVEREESRPRYVTPGWTSRLELGDCTIQSFERLKLCDFSSKDAEYRWDLFDTARRGWAACEQYWKNILYTLCIGGIQEVTSASSDGKDRTRENVAYGVILISAGPYCYDAQGRQMSRIHFPPNGNVRIDNADPHDWNCHLVPSERCRPIHINGPPRGVDTQALSTVVRADPHQAFPSPTSSGAGKASSQGSAQRTSRSVQGTSSTANEAPSPSAPSMAHRPSHSNQAFSPGRASNQGRGNDGRHGEGSGNQQQGRAGNTWNSPSGSRRDREGSSNSPMGKYYY